MTTTFWHFCQLLGGFCQFWRFCLRGISTLSLSPYSWISTRPRGAKTDRRGAAACITGASLAHVLASAMDAPQVDVGATIGSTPSTGVVDIDLRGVKPHHEEEQHE
jgi:hypothetical protein